MASRGGRGRFIAFEGGEGAGKSTQARLLAEALAGRGIPVETTREPGGTPGAEAIRGLLLTPPGEGWTGEAEALLFAAARADHVARRIRPALEAGRWVVCDRFVDSSRAYQGGAGGLGDAAILALHDFGSGGLRPDLTVLLDVAEAQVARRLAARDGAQSDAIGGRSANYHRAVAASFRRMAAADPAGIAVIDGAGEPEEVQARVLAALAPIMPEGAR
ncbi:dTMP kinase [Erythrobacter sp. HL-111]|uniref:dTMP kinase n=1 Tax=Erythrobacter sp. HL-111 TaxID=1798193 RepID=UPI0006D9DF83|nr:dTMP kinase [Erythrobacter sp. HL-111]KPP85436.1 MAG: dTMP kinase Tmk [Erythrobacteraceae bacterium HL-111]SDR96428.1 thymidylate kinase [Erythrobacter sp. HL-111]